MRIAYITDGEHTLTQRLLPQLPGLCGVVDFAAPARLRPVGATEHWCRQRQVAYWRAERSDKHAVADILKAWRVDLLISYYAPILPAAVIEAPSLAAINLHPSLLPNYRGASPLFWAVHDLQAQMGSSVHLLTEGIDSGPILAQAAITRPEGASQQQLTRQLVDKLGCHLLLESVADFARDAIKAEAQPPTHTAYAKRFAPSQLLSHLRIEHLSARQWWNIGRFYDYWPAPLRTLRPWQRYVRWQVAEQYHEQALAAPWQLSHARDRYWLNLPTGRLAVVPRLQSKHLLKAGLRKMGGVAQPG